MENKKKGAEIIYVSEGETQKFLKVEGDNTSLLAAFYIIFKKLIKAGMKKEGILLTLFLANRNATQDDVDGDKKDEQ